MLRVSTCQACSFCARFITVAPADRCRSAYALLDIPEVEIGRFVRWIDEAATGLAVPGSDDRNVRHALRKLSSMLIAMPVQVGPGVLAAAAEERPYDDMGE